MKKRWKIFTITCAVVAAVGIALCLISYVLGGFSDLDLAYNRVWGPFGYFTGHNDSGFEAHEVRNADTKEDFEGISSIEMSVTSCEVHVEESDNDKVTIETENIPKKLRLQYYKESNGKLVIKTNENKIVPNRDARIYITIPKNTKYDEAELAIGAGALYVDRINAEVLAFDVGAGFGRIDDFEAGSLSASCGAGEMKLTGDCKNNASVDCGMGRAELNMTGEETDFDYSIECGMGQVKYGRSVFAGMAKEADSLNGAPKRMDISCGMGSVEIAFI